MKLNKEGARTRHMAQDPATEGEGLDTADALHKHNGCWAEVEQLDS
jgi:hypothetical protein